MPSTSSKLATLCVLVASSVAGASAESRVDALFAGWSHPDTPGCAVGIIEDGAFVYRQAYGAANLEHDVPLSSSSVFRMASVSKQFAAFAVLLAEQQGRLALDDDIRKFIPELPVVSPAVTLRHLIHHTSGIRDYLTVMYLAGFDEDAIYTNEEVLERLSLLEGTNFAAGSEYLYSNSGYFLLSQIVLRATGLALSEFSEKFIFEPLGMNHTHFHDDLRKVVKSRASGYRPRAEGGFELHGTGLNMVGDGGLYTSVDDLLAWDRNFYTGEVGGEILRRRRLQTPTLSDGTPQIYAAGVQVTPLRGRRTISHGGSWVGFRTAMLMYPEERLSVYVLCNVSTATPTIRAREIADIYLELPESGPPSSRVELSEEALADRAGVYWNDERAELLDLSVATDTLTWKQTRQTLVPMDEDRWIGSSSDEEPVELRFRVDGETRLVTLSRAGQRVFVYERARREDPMPPVSEQRHLIGLYRCNELDVTYRVEPDGSNALRLVTPGFESTLQRVFGDVYRWDEGSVVLRRDDGGRVSGFELAAGRARHFSFEKL